MQASPGHKLDIFRVVDASLRQEDKRLRCHFNKAAAYINDLFMTMGNYDVRFHFDPVSLDDCRCNIISPKQVSLLCVLKEVPHDSFVLSGQLNSGGILVELKENYVTRCDKACWDDVITQGPTGRRFVSTKKLLLTLHEVIQQSIDEIFQETNTEDIHCHLTGGQLSVIVRWGSSSDQLRVNLLPAIQVKRFVDPLPKFDRRFRQVLKSLNLPNVIIDSFCLVAKPFSSKHNLSWRITFNDIENRIFNAQEFQCGRHCLHTLDKFCAKYAPFWGTGQPLLCYHLQVILLNEFLAHPLSKDWKPEKFYQRLKSTMTSLCKSLREKKCVNIFTGVNVFAQCDVDTMEALATKLSKIKMDFREISSLL